MCMQLLALDRTRKEDARAALAAAARGQYVTCEEMNALDAEEKAIRQLPSEVCRQLLVDTALQLLCKELSVCAVCDEFQIDVTTQPKWIDSDRLALDELKRTSESGPEELCAQYCAHPTVCSVHAVRVQCCLCAVPCVRVVHCSE
jgi:hypothetical protein